MHFCLRLNCLTLLGSPTIMGRVPQLVGACLPNLLQFHFHTITMKAATPRCNEPFCLQLNTLTLLGSPGSMGQMPRLVGL